MRLTFAATAALAVLALAGAPRVMTALMPTAAAQTSSPSATAAPASAAAAVRTLGEFTDARGFRRLYLLVPPKLDDAQIIALAQQVHQKEKNAWLWLLDSDEKAKQMLAALPRTQQGDMKGYPGKWVETHTVAHSALNMLPKGAGRQWTLYKGPYTSQPLGPLPCIDGAGGCTR